MKIKLGYSMGYAGTDIEWEEWLPETVDPNNEAEVATYLEARQQELWEDACERISTWAEIKE